jgi:Ser/Thr protein kinase RdoA (MazF antagonist)
MLRAACADLSEKDEPILPTFDNLSFQQQLPLLLELAHAALTHYALPTPLEISLVNLSENATYKLEAPDGRRWALRIHRDGYHTKTAIASELSWLIDLRSSGVVTTPQPVRGRDGEFIQQAAHPSMAQPRFIVVFEWETGIEPNIQTNLIGPFQILGEVAARMHLHARQWQRPTWFNRFTWDFETSLGNSAPHWGHWRDGVGVDARMEKLFERTVFAIGERLRRYGKEADRFGLIHGDLRLANLLVDRDNVKVIDFDDSGFGWFMYDAATPVSFYEHEPQVPELIDAWKTGYRRVSALSKQDEAEIPTFIMLRRLLLVAWIGSHHETELAKSMGVKYTQGSTGLCETFLSQNT